MPEYMANSLVPLVMVEQLIETGKITLQGYYRDPFLLETAFTRKTITASWSGTGDTITGDFTDTDHVDYLWMQVHIHDQASTNHLDYFFDGGVITEYKWIIEAGKAIVEEVTIEFSSMTKSTTACDIDDGLDDGSFDRAGVDGGWSMWNGRYSAKNCAHSKDATLTFGGAAVADLNIKKCTLGMRLTKKYEPNTSSKVMALAYSQTHEYYMDLEGILQDYDTHTQALTVYDSKTTGICKVAFGDEYLQFTIGYLDQIEKMVDAAEKLAAQEVIFHYKGGSQTAMSYQWSGNEATDPSAYINHSNP
jgi:hypothetical protein